MNSTHRAYVTHTGDQIGQIPEKGKGKAVKFQNLYFMRY